jgi:ribonuclease Z
MMSRRHRVCAPGFSRSAIAVLAVPLTVAALAGVQFPSRSGSLSDPPGIINTSANANATGQNVSPAGQVAPRTKLIMLGTGHPGANPDRFGPATVVLVDGIPYLVDVGVGVVRRWTAAVRKHQLPAASFQEAAAQLRIAFVTHLHTDHTLGYSDLIFTPWTQRRVQGGVPGFPALEVFGPKGLRAMTDHLIAAYAEDVRIRLSEGGERPGGIAPVVNVHEIGAGVVFKDARVTVTAFNVPHGTWPQAFGYRFDTPDKRIVISGDTSPSATVAQQCGGCDILVHEGGRPTATGADAAYARSFHTDAEGLARVANEAKPKLLVLYHQVDANEEGLRIIRSRYAGRIVVAEDLDLLD